MGAPRRTSMWLRSPRTVSLSGSANGPSPALPATSQGLRDVPLPDDAVGRAVLSDDRLVALARTAKQIEKAFGYPVDLEWLYDAHGLWLLQARPISGLTRPLQLTNDD